MGDEDEDEDEDEEGEEKEEGDNDIKTWKFCQLSEELDRMYAATYSEPMATGPYRIWGGSLPSLVLTVVVDSKPRTQSSAPTETLNPPARIH